MWFARSGQPQPSFDICQTFFFIDLFAMRRAYIEFTLPNQYHPTFGGITHIMTDRKPVNKYNLITI